MNTQDTGTDFAQALELITLRMTSGLHLEEVLQTITDGLTSELRAAAAFIWLTDSGESPGLTLGSRAGLAPISPDAPPKVHWILDQRDHFCTNNPPTDGSVGPAAWILENGLRAHGGFPLIFGDDIHGVMTVYNHAPFSQQEFERLFFFARQAAVAIQNARLYTRIEELTSRLKAENSYLREETEFDYNCGDIVGRSPAILAVLGQVKQVAPTQSTVLIGGETGTGKELVALSIHNRSQRAGRPMVKVNCGAISAGLVESELFGHERGAFTGAVEKRIGRFELADGGTLFLDEVGELPLETQVKLLRALQEQEFERLGSSQPIQVDVRVIAATNRDLAAEVRAGRFRSDLYYRLNVFPIKVPPLRDRLDDVPLIAGCVLGRVAQKVGKEIAGIGPAAYDRLGQYHWPGNVRELLNVIERAAILSAGPWIEDIEILGNETMAGTSAVGTSAVDQQPLATLEQVERQHIERVLEHTGGVIQGDKGASVILGMHPNTLRSRMQKLAIRRPDR